MQSFPGFIFQFVLCLVLYMDLHSKVQSLPKIGPAFVQKLENLHIFTVRDLLFHIPSRYKDYRLRTVIAEAQPGEVVTIVGTIEEFKNIFTKYGKRIQQGVLADESGTIQLVFFNQIFLTQTIKKGMKLAVSGKVEKFNGKISMMSPEYEIVYNEEKPLLHTGRIVPIYPETKGISSKWLRHKVDLVWNTIEERLIDDYLDQGDRDELHFQSLQSALHTLHYPSNFDEIVDARRRLAFDELLRLQIIAQKRKIEWQANQSAHKLTVDKKALNDFLQSLPFTLTDSQTTAIDQILLDLKELKPMNRLLEGDVGSGKTVVAAAAIFASFMNGFQSIIMAPTQILAEQHYQTLTRIFEPFKLRITMITGAGVKGDIGRNDVFVGTHALLNRDKLFEKVGFVAIDEQHRFGVSQRALLSKKTGSKNKVPHVLTMTATPIPRTIALVAYGDLSLSVLHELPKGRQPITTWVVPPEKRDSGYEWIGKRIDEEGIQVYVVCPLIEDSETETMKDVKSVTAEFERIKVLFPNKKVLLLHGRMKSQEKTDVLNQFREGKADILVSTPVIEVGIDVPNATIMVIEASDRFGLAQLHQLRGRVGRGEKKSYCMLFSENKSKVTLKRLRAMTEGKTGFELAELDLQMRGPGELYGIRQHGFPELKIARWDDKELIGLAKSYAEKIIGDKDKIQKVLFEFRDEKDIAKN